MQNNIYTLSCLTLYSIFKYIFLVPVNIRNLKPLKMTHNYSDSSSELLCTPASLFDISLCAGIHVHCMTLRIFVTLRIFLLLLSDFVKFGCFNFKV